jgi:acyl carrier protein
VSDAGAQVRAEMQAWLAEQVDDPSVLDSLSDGTDLLAEGVIDSFTMLELLSWFEERFGVFVDFADATEPLTQVGPLVGRVAELMVASDLA